MAKKALCVGINDYPYEGNDLNGCVNDANAWARLLTDHFDFAKPDVKLLTDAEAKKKDIIGGLKKLFKGARAGDVLVFSNSSHGSYVAERGGDEDQYDEILCPYDIADNHIVDDELRELIAGLPDGVRLTVILDNCFSGTGTRAAIDELLPGTENADDRRIRFLSPALRGLPVLENPWSARPRSVNRYPESQMKEVLLSGCTDREYSYDAFINGFYHGAMSYFALFAIKQANYRLTYAQLHTRLRTLIRAYPQHPQLEGQTSNKRGYVFV